MLEVSNLAVDYATTRPPVHALRDVSLAVRPGEIVGLVGESGSGKSTVVRSVIGLITPPGRIVSGSVTLNGAELLGMPRRKLRTIRGARIGFVGQNPFGSLHPLLTVGDQLANVIRAHGKASKVEIAERCASALTSVGLRDTERVLKSYVHELSGGMAQRVVIAISLLLEPEMVIADEPTTALDVTVQLEIMQLIRRLVDERGMSVLLVTHDLGVVANFCDRAVVLYAGTVVEAGRTREVFAAPHHPYTRALLDSVPDPETGGLRVTSRAAGGLTPSGACPYQSQCPYAFDRCGTERPRPRNIGGRSVSCHLDEMPAAVGNPAIEGGAS